MRGSHVCEILAWRLACLARLVARRRQADGASERMGEVWQQMVFTTARATQPHADAQGPGRGKLFGNYGASGMPAEIDTAVDDGAGILSLIESKAVSDYALRRNEAFIFSGKIRDHEASQAFRWRGVYALMASAGRLDAIFCRWCFCEGIDVVDPDRLSLNVLARLPYILNRNEFALLQDHHRYDWLRDILQISRDETINGPVLLRHPNRRGKLKDTTLHDLNEIQAKLSESVWAAVATNVSGDGTEEERDAILLDRAYREFQEIGVTLPAEAAFMPARVIALSSSAP